LTVTICHNPACSTSRNVLVAAMAFASGPASVSAATALDASLPAYQAVEGVSGQIKSEAAKCKFCWNSQRSVI